MEREVYKPSQTVPLSKAVKYNGLWYLSGEVGIDPQTGKIVEGGIVAQTEQTLKNLGETLKAIGSSFDKVIKTTVFLTDVNDFDKMNSVYAKFFPVNPPARSTVGVAALARPGLCVEIELIAAP